MNIEQFLDQLPEYAVDIKINTKNLLNATVLSKKQVLIIFTACAFAVKNKDFFNIVKETTQLDLTPVEIDGAKIAATMMSMNNIYYRFVHLVSNDEYYRMPLGLRMNGISPSKHGIDPIDFEFASIAVSSINGCGMCMDSHEKTLKKHGVESIKIQEAIKIAAVVYALCVVQKDL